MDEPETHAITNAEINAEAERPPGPLPPARRTIRFAVRAAWDALGFVCAASLTLFVLLAFPLILLANTAQTASLPARLAGVGAAAILYLALIPPAYAGVCWLARLIIEHDEASYLDILRGARRMYGRAFALGFAQLGITTVLLANLVFYLSRGGFLFLILAVLFLYLLVFWGMNAVYHWPLLVAVEAGVLLRDGDRPSGLGAVFRNAFLLAFSAPGFTFAVLLLIIVLGVPLSISGVGLALLFPGFTAFLTTQAARDQLVRFHVLPAQPDPDEPVVDERWRVS
jgi:hypothetical protein